MLRVFALMFAGLLASTPSLAADNGVYLGVGISQAAVDVEYDAGPVTIPFDGDDTKFKVIAGVRPLDWLAFEVNYVDFGTIETSFATQKLKGFDAFAVGLLEVGVVDLFAKAGVIRWDQEIDFSSPLLTDRDDTGNDLAYGAGIGVHFGSVGVRAEYEKFEVSDDTDVDLISLSLTWTFL